MVESAKDIRRFIVERTAHPNEDVLDGIVELCQEFFMLLQVVANELKLTDIDRCICRVILGEEDDRLAKCVSEADLIENIVVCRSDVTKKHVRLYDLITNLVHERLRQNVVVATFNPQSVLFS